jgi:hypothetical protein
MEPKDLLLRHFEKIALAVFAAFFGWVAYVFLLGRPTELQDNTKLQDTIKNIETHMTTYSAQLPVLQDPMADLMAQLDPARVSPGEQFPGWLAHRRPNVAIAHITGPEKVYPKHEAPTDFHVVTEKTGRGHVTLSWKASTENEYVNITGYEVFRKDKPDGEWKSIAANLDAAKTEYEDTSVGPRGKYWYRLKETAAAQLDNPIIVRDKTNLAPEKCDLYAEDTKDPVQTPQDIYITIDGGTPTDPTTDVKGEIQCKVWRWNAAAGKFISKGYTKIVAGTKIGAKEKIREGGKSVDFDFSTDAQLVEVKSEKRKTKTGVERDTIIAHVKWPWGDEEDIVEKELPAEIAAQKGK